VVAILSSGLPPAYAPGIAAEIPQDLHGAGRDFLKNRTSRPWAQPHVGKAKRPAAHATWQIRGIGAESPVLRLRRKRRPEKDILT
jgi:hypothetical protein